LLHISSSGGGEGGKKEGQHREGWPTKARSGAHRDLGPDRQEGGKEHLLLARQQKKKEKGASPQTPAREKRGTLSARLTLSRAIPPTLLKNKIEKKEEC